MELYIILYNNKIVCISAKSFLVVKDIMIEKTEFDNVNDFQPLAEKSKYCCL